MTEVDEIIAEIDEIFNECTDECQIEHYSGSTTERALMSAMIYVAKLLREVKQLLEE